MKELGINTGFVRCFISHSIYICKWTRRVRPFKDWRKITQKTGFC